MKATVVDSVEPTLGPVVLSANSWEESFLITQGNIECVNPVVLAANNQLCENDRCFSVQSRVADVVLPGPSVRGVENEVSRGFVIGRCRRDGGHVGSVPRLGHCK